LRKLRADYKTATPDQIAEIQTKWNEAIAKAEAMIDPLREAGKAAYLAAPNSDNSLTEFLVKLVVDDVARTTMSRPPTWRRYWPTTAVTRKNCSIQRA